jgi:hypothetical protein
MRISVTGAAALRHTLEETLRDEIAWFRQRQVN